MAVRMAQTQVETEWHLQLAAQLAPLDESRARRELSEIAGDAEDENLPRLAKFLGGKGAAQEFLAAVFDLSSFLRDIARRRPQILDALLDESVEARLRAIGEAIDEAAF